MRPAWSDEPARGTAFTRGRTARRAVARWAWRMFRREWRQQILVLALLTAAVATSIGFALAAYLTTPVPDNADFGAASHFIRLSGTDPQILQADVAAAREVFDTHEVIYHRPVPVPGLFEPVDFRAQDPDGPLGSPRLALREGTYPAGSQVAVTDGVADLLGLDIGVSLALDGVSRTVVGVIENPGNLADEFVLVAPSQTDGATGATVLVDASDDQVLSFRIPSGGGLAVGSRSANQDVVAAVGVLVFSTVGLLLIALIATASFVVIAHRRMRQLGMLAAIGATEKQLRLVTLANGTVIGGIAAVLGAAIGVAGWVGVAPAVENAVGYRVDQLDVPLWLVAVGMLLAVVAGTAAAWWPARNVARVPAVRALSGRPPEPKPARRAAALAAVLAVVGVACLALGGDVVDETAVDWVSAGLIVAGIVAVALSMMLACPLAIRVLGISAGRLPVAVRLATGDLARYRARSGAALAAISLAVGIAVTVIASTAAAQADADEGNLGEYQVLIRAADLDGPFIPEADAFDGLQAGVDRVATAFSGAQVTRLDVAIDPASEPDPSFSGREAIVLGERSGDGWNDISLLYVATPQLLAYYGYDLDAVAPSTVVITREAGQFAILGEVGATRSQSETLSGIEAIRPGYESLPGTFATTQVISERGWVTAPSGRWLVNTQEVPTTEQLTAARELAAGAGLTIEVRDRQGGLGALRTAATAAGVLVALGIVAMAVGLVRSEAGRDLRILTATGATRRTRRTLTAATAGGLAALGVILGAAGAYLGLTAGFARDLGALSPVPVVHLAALFLGLPLIATLAGWLISGRGIIDIARQPME
jgi:putative ABC transport system permease protein